MTVTLLGEQLVATEVPGSGGDEFDLAWPTGGEAVGDLLILHWARTKSIFDPFPGRFVILSDGGSFELIVDDTLDGSIAPFVSYPVGSNTPRRHGVVPLVITADTPDPIRVRYVTTGTASDTGGALALTSWSGATFGYLGKARGDLNGTIPSIQSATHGAVSASVDWFGMSSPTVPLSGGESWDLAPLQPGVTQIFEQPDPDGAIVMAELPPGVFTLGCTWETDSPPGTADGYWGGLALGLSDDAPPDPPPPDPGVPEDGTAFLPVGTTFDLDSVTEPGPNRYGLDVPLFPYREGR